MALAELLALSGERQKIGLSEERINAIIPEARKYISFWREYPDIFIDFMLDGRNPQNFEFYFYQRVFLRVCMRHQYVYAVFPRACIRNAPIIF